MHFVKHSPHAFVNHPSNLPCIIPQASPLPIASTAHHCTYPSPLRGPPSGLFDTFPAIFVLLRQLKPDRHSEGTAYVTDLRASSHWIHLLSSLPCQHLLKTNLIPCTATPWALVPRHIQKISPTLLQTATPPQIATARLCILATRTIRQ